MPLIHYTRTGTGAPPFVFVHGFGCARSDWDGQVAHLSPRHETIAVDLGAHGTTPGRPEHTQLEPHGADVAALMKDLKLAPSVLVGHSMGCRVVMEAALRAPEHTRAIILVDGSRLGETGSAAWKGRARTLRELGYAKFVEGAFRQMFGPDYDQAKADVIVKRAMDRDPVIAGGLFVDIGRYDAENMDRLLSSIRVPMLLIQTTVTHPDGKRASLAPGQTTPYLDLVRKNVAHARVEIIAGIGHFPQLERVAETNALIDGFVRGLG